MDEALVEHTQDDVQREQRGEDEERLGLQHRPERARGTLEAATHRAGHSEAREGILDRAGGLRQRHAFRQVEGDRRGDELRVVIDGERRLGRGVAREQRKRHLRAAGDADVQLVEGCSRLQEFGRGLHHDVVLVEGRVDGRDLPLRERVVQRGVDQLRRHAEARRGVAIDDDRGGEPLVLLIGVDVGKLGQARERLADARLPDPQLLEVVGLDRVLVRGAALPAADAYVLDRVEDEVGTGLPGEPGAQPRHDPVGALPALGERFQRDEHRPGVALAAAGVADDALDARVGAHDVDEGGELVAHRLERDALIGLDAARELARVLLREEALGHDHVEHHVERHRRQQEQRRQRTVVQRPGQRALVTAQHRGEPALAPLVKPALAALLCRHEQPRAHHRRGGERDHQRNQDRRGQRHRELAEEAAHEPAHEQHRNEDGDERQGHRQHREAHFPGPDPRRLPRRHAALDVARHVFQDHDRVVDHEAGGDRECHQRQVVQAVAGKVHDAEGRGERHRHGDTRNERRAAVAQEQEHDEDDQRHGQRQRLPGVPQGRPDGGGALHHHPEVDRARDRRGERRQQLRDTVDGLDDVGVGLAADDHEHRRPAVGRPRIAQVLHGVDDLGHRGQLHRSAIAVGNDQREVVGRALRLVVGVDLPGARAVFHRALGPVGVGPGERGAHVLEADAVLVKGLRVDFDAHRGQRAATDLDLAHARDLRQLLCDDGRRRVVHLPLRHGVRRERQDHHRRVGRVDLAVRRIAVEAGGQRAAGRVQRRLHVARRAVDVAVELELQHDARRTEGTGRRHLRDAGDAAERALERHRDGRCHRLRARSGQRSGYGDGRQVDPRQRRHRKQAEGHGAGQRDADREQRRRDRAIDEGRRNIHAARLTQRRRPMPRRAGARAARPSGAPADRTRDR